MTCSKLAVLNKAIQGAFLSLKKLKIDSKDMDSYLIKGLWRLIKQSKTLFKSQKRNKIEKHTFVFNYGVVVANKVIH